MVLRQMCDVILRFAEEGEEFHGKAALGNPWNAYTYIFTYART